MKFWFLLFQWPPLLSDCNGGQFYFTFWSEVIQGYLWGKMMKMRGLAPNQQVFSDLQKKIIFVTTYKFRRALSRRNFEFCPWIKIKYCFQKKFFISKSKSRNSSLDPAIFKIPKFFVTVAPNIFHISWGVCSIHFLSPMVLKCPF